MGSPLSASPPKILTHIAHAMASEITEWTFLLSELAFSFVFIGFIACGVINYLNYLRVMFYLLKTKPNEYLAIGVNLRLMILSQLFPVCAVIVLILSLVFLPTLSFVLFLTLIVLPSPLYMMAARSAWRYQTNSRSALVENDPLLNSLRTQNKRVVRGILKLMLIATCISFAIVLIGLILHWGYSAAQHLSSFALPTTIKTAGSERGRAMENSRAEVSPL